MILQEQWIDLGLRYGLSEVIMIEELIPIWWVCLPDCGKIGPTTLSTSPSPNSFQTGRVLKLEGLQGPLLSGMFERALGRNSETGY